MVVTETPSLAYCHTFAVCFLYILRQVTHGMESVLMEEMPQLDNGHAWEQVPNAITNTITNTTAGPTATKRLIKLTVNVSSEAYTALKEMAAQRGVTVTEMLRQAISTAKWVQDTTAQGEKILKQDRQGHLFEVVF